MLRRAAPSGWLSNGKQTRDDGTIKTAKAQFPVEVWEAIIDACPSIGTRLFPLLFVNSAFLHVVERVLYKHIDLTADHLLNAPRRIQLFHRLADDTSVAQLVESFILPPLRIRHFPDIHKLGDHIFESYFTFFHRALCAMRNLTSLSLSNRFSNTGWAFLRAKNLDEFFDGCVFRLRRLHIISIQDSQNNQECVSLLEAQHQGIEELSIPPILAAAFSDKPFPKLGILHLSSPGVNHLPPVFAIHPHIWAFYWYSVYPVIEARAFPNVRALRLAFADELDLSTLAKMFPSLRYLRIDLRTFHYKWDFHSIWLVDNCGSLVHLPSLSKLVLGGETPLSWCLYSGRQHIAGHLFRSVPQLSTVLIGVEQWERNQLDRVGLMHPSPDEWKDLQWRG